LFNLPTAIAHLHWPEPFFTCVDAAGGQWTDDMTAQNACTSNFWLSEPLYINMNQVGDPLPPVDLL